MSKFICSHLLAVSVTLNIVLAVLLHYFTTGKVAVQVASNGWLF